MGSRRDLEGGRESEIRAVDRRDGDVWMRRTRRRGDCEVRKMLDGAGEKERERKPKTTATSHRPVNGSIMRLVHEPRRSFSLSLSLSHSRIIGRIFSQLGALYRLAPILL
jgi:hypothetical protein